MLLILTGLLGSGLALYAATIDRTHALNDVAGMFVAHGDVKRFFNASVGIGIWICVIGGLIAIVAGIMELRSRSAAQSAMDGSEAMSIGASPPMGSAALTSSPTDTSTPAPSIPEMPPDTPDAGGDAPPS